MVNLNFLKVSVNNINPTTGAAISPIQCQYR